MEEIIIRVAVLEDAGGIAWVHGRARQTAYIGLLPEERLKNLDESYDQRIEDWRERLSDPASGLAMFVAEDGGEVVGIAGGNKESSGDWRFDGELQMIYILEEYQQQGIGRWLVREVALALMERAMRSMIVWVFKDSPYRTFYEALGGVYVGEKEHEIWGVKYKLAGYGWENLADLTGE
ncbi:MAG: GNAT family N-acetyltransferase [Chloroflexota bacterium]